MAFFTYITTSKNKLGYFKQFNSQKKKKKQRKIKVRIQNIKEKLNKLTEDRNCA